MRSTMGGCSGVREALGGFDAPPDAEGSWEALDTDALGADVGGGRDGSEPGLPNVELMKASDVEATAAVAVAATSVGWRDALGMIRSLVGVG